MSSYINHNGINTTIGEGGMTLEMVLNDQVAPPFSLRDFTDYLDQTYSFENLAFYRAFHWIIETFIQNNAVQEINIPADMKSQLLSYLEHQQYHPALLHPACSSILELLRVSAFIPFATDPHRITHHSFHTSTVSLISRTTYNPSSSNHPSIPPCLNHSISSSLIPFALRRQKSSPSLSTSSSTFSHSVPLPPPRPLPSLSTVPSLSYNHHKDKKEDAVSITSDNEDTFFKKLSTSFRLRTSSTPQRSHGWKQINIPDTSIFRPTCHSMEQKKSHTTTSNTTTTTI
ncbi:uncharacterized protein BX664DRAFT_385145 [Halteromyces radiatus]|uniref:uncharacterized protein n=1 Tax=Halteromyces radiatus TaxID=101107 RepID=UPI0022210A2A|nr:uncharacterized protein BX664DRAFT_385145 [Halteromyces radiatus]KAI8093778.1 hypothetical protein BX664DRAFT_385145 [Halteromyces radiatus]